MPPAVQGRDPSALLALALKRGPQTISDLAALARGERIPQARHTDLVRAGLVRARSQQLPPRLMVPVLALEAALSLDGGGMLNKLLALLQGAGDRPARDSYLEALASTLAEHLDALKQAPAGFDAQALTETLDDLALTVSRLAAEDADPSLATRVAVLCARLVEQVARTLGGRRRLQEQPQLEILPLEALASAARDLVVALPRPLAVPSPAALAGAAAGPQPLPRAGERRTLAVHATTADRGQAVEKALAGAAPLADLYGGLALEEALARHVRLVGLGRQMIDEAGWLPIADRVEGPAPLVWSTALAEARPVVIEAHERAA